ncbi:hypothetical protein DRP04_00810 [Archaeoglobales archaeon]|nr:MAG: hypothetical protein DRP04_00810 [Archaeoglobales archaeon]
MLYSALRKALRRFEAELDTGNVTSATANTLTDSSKNWGTDIWKDMYVEITGGTGAGQIRRISGNTSDTITVTENWSETPDETSTYRIFGGITELSLLEGIKGNTDKLDITLSSFRDALKGANDKDFSTLEADIESILAQLDVALSTRASENTLSGIKTQTDKFQFDADNFLRIALANSEILQPIDIQSHWGEAVTLLASGERTADGTGDDVNVEKFMVGELCIDVTAVSGAFASGEGLRVIVEGKDEVSGKYRTIYDSYDSLGAMITSPITDWLTITTLAFRLLRVRWEISGTDPSFTFSVSMQGKA